MGGGVGGGGGGGGWVGGSRIFGCGGKCSGGGLGVWSLLSGGGQCAWGGGGVLGKNPEKNVKSNVKGDRAQDKGDLQDQGWMGLSGKGNVGMGTIKRHVKACMAEEQKRRFA